MRKSKGSPSILERAARVGRRPLPASNKRGVKKSASGLKPRVLELSQRGSLLEDLDKFSTDLASYASTEVTEQTDETSVYTSTWSVAAESIRTTNLGQSPRHHASENDRGRNEKTSNDSEAENIPSRVRFDSEEDEDEDVQSQKNEVFTVNEARGERVRAIWAQGTMLAVAENNEARIPYEPDIFREDSSYESDDEDLQSNVNGPRGPVHEASTEEVRAFLARATGVVMAEKDEERIRYLPDTVIEEGSSYDSIEELNVECLSFLEEDDSSWAGLCGYMEGFTPPVINDVSPSFATRRKFSEEMIPRAINEDGSRSQRSKSTATESGAICVNCGGQSSGCGDGMFCC